MIFQNIKLALKDMGQSKLRTFLSFLGIIIGVASVVIILTLGAALSSFMVKQMNIGGVDVIPIMFYPDPTSEKKLDERFADVIFDNVENLDLAVPTYNVGTQLVTDAYNQHVQINGTSSKFLELFNIKLLAGENFNSLDNASGRKVAIIGEKIAAKLFPDGNVLGSTFKIIDNYPIELKVIGIMGKKSIYNLNTETEIIVPSSVIDLNYKNHSFSLYIKTAKNTNAKIISDKLNSFLKGYIGSQSYNIFSAAELMETMNAILKSVNLFLAAIAAISLLVGGIGIMNIMLVSVVERTKEIGIRKALGAKPSTIRSQFVTQAMVTTLIGGILGALFGLFVSKIVCDVVGWDFLPNYLSVILICLFTSVVGIFFGWYPAKRASKLDPIEALNYE